jgi:KipI family sensor histidine kinase inhibitor
VSDAGLANVVCSALGDSAVLLSLGEAADDATARRVSCLLAALESERPAYVTDLVPAFTTVAVFYDPLAVPTSRSYPSAQAVVRRWVLRVAAEAGQAVPPEPWEVVIPVCYGGEWGTDLEEVAAHCGLSADEVVRRHSSASYSVRAVGFMPGFPYLAGLPPELATPRRATPRTSVKSGTVGIGGAQTGVYPLASPGGWNLIGRTPIGLFDPRAAEPALLRAGDSVRFEPITQAQFAESDGARMVAHLSLDSTTSLVYLRNGIEVLKPGLQTTVQDLGRPGWQSIGVTPGGAMDREAARIANWLVGNEAAAPVLECVLIGSELRFQSDALIAVTGGEVAGLPGWRPIRVHAGEVLNLQRLETGARIYLSVAGGFAVPAVLGGSGTHLRAGVGGFEGRALRAGDVLSIGSRLAAALGGDSERPGIPPWFITPKSRPSYSPSPQVRVVRGAQSDWFDAESWKRFRTKPYLMQPQSDRMGMRLIGAPLKLAGHREMASEAVAFGSVQVPPDGQPIILLADRQTLGGYAKIANVISVDLPLLAQLKPGDAVRFREVSVVEAEEALLVRDRELAVLRDAVAKLL